MNVLTPRMAATLGVASGKGSRSEPPHDICACTHFAQRAPPLPKLPWSLCEGERTSYIYWNAYRTNLSTRKTTRRMTVSTLLFLWKLKINLYNRVLEYTYLKNAPRRNVATHASGVVRYKCQILLAFVITVIRHRYYQSSCWGSFLDGMEITLHNRGFRQIAVCKHQVRHYTRELMFCIVW